MSFNKDETHENVTTEPTSTTPAKTVSKKYPSWAVVVYTFNPSTGEAEVSLRPAWSTDLSSRTASKSYKENLSWRKKHPPPNNELKEWASCPQQSDSSSLGCCCQMSVYGDSLEHSQKKLLFLLKYLISIILDTRKNKTAFALMGAGKNHETKLCSTGPHPNLHIWQTLITKFSFISIHYRQLTHFILTFTYVYVMYSGHIQPLLSSCSSFPPPLPAQSSFYSMSFCPTPYFR